MGELRAEWTRACRRMHGFTGRVSTDQREWREMTLVGSGAMVLAAAGEGPGREKWGA